MTATRTDEQEFGFRLEMQIDDLYERLFEFQCEREVPTDQVNRWLSDDGLAALIDGYESWILDHIDDDLITEVNGERWMESMR